MWSDKYPGSTSRTARHKNVRRFEDETGGGDFSDQELSSLASLRSGPARQNVGSQASPATASSDDSLISPDIGLAENQPEEYPSNSSGHAKVNSDTAEEKMFNDLLESILMSYQGHVGAGAKTGEREDLKEELSGKTDHNSSLSEQEEVPKIVASEAEGRASFLSALFGEDVDDDEIFWLEDVPQMGTDEECRRYAQKVWNTDQIRNPNSDLTYFSFRQNFGRLNENSYSSPPTEGKRKASPEFSPEFNKISKVQLSSTDAIDPELESKSEIEDTGEAQIKINNSRD